MVATEVNSHFVDVSNVRKIYNPGQDEVEAVSNASFHVAQTEFVSILGPSGCGKSTLLMMIAGLEPLTAGTITVDRTPIRKPRAEIGVMFQDATLLPWKTSLENVLYPARILKLPLEEQRRRATELLEMVNLGGFLDKVPDQLSGGMRQRVAICRALVYDPKLLLMDEPFSALDAITRDEMAELLLEIWQTFQKCAIFVTHSIREAILLSDRVLIMNARPSTIVADIRVPFPRPRRRDIAETVEFARLSAELRDYIEAGRGPRADRAQGGLRVEREKTPRLA